jgi:hypothetical protein
MITQAQRDEIRRDFGPGTVPIMLLDELEHVEASARAALGECQRQLKSVIAELTLVRTLLRRQPRNQPTQKGNNP